MQNLAFGPTELPIALGQGFTWDRMRDFVLACLKDVYLFMNEE